jgi:hypothetical protein
LPAPGPLVAGRAGAAASTEAGAGAAGVALDEALLAGPLAHPVNASASVIAKAARAGARSRRRAVFAEVSEGMFIEGLLAKKRAGPNGLPVHQDDYFSTILKVPTP